MKKKLPALFLLLSLIFSLSTQAIIAKENDLIIQDDGKIVLVISTNGVLGIETKPSSVLQSNPQQQNQNKPQTAPLSLPQTPSPVKTVPLIPPRTESTVQINPPINNGKKLEVIISTQTTAQASPPITKPTITALTTPQLDKSSIPQPQAISIQHTVSGISPNPPITKPSTSVSAITKIVDQVVAQNIHGQPVITIRSEKTHQLTIQQGTTQVTTLLPLQIDTLTHSLSVPSANDSAKVSVLPTEALQGIIDRGFLNTQSISQVKINLTQDINGVTYTVDSQKKGKLFGIFDVQSPVQVKLSAQTGKVVKTSQSLLFNIFGGFIK